MKTIAKVAQSLKSMAENTKSYKQAMEVLDAQRNIFEETSISTETVLHDMPVTINNDKVKAWLSKYAVVEVTNTGYTTIYVDDDLLDLDSDVIKFILLHEEGHVKLHMSDDFKEMLKNTAKRQVLAVFGRPSKEEIEADRYAAEQMGVKEAVVAMRRFVNEMADSGVTKHALAEPRRRLAILEQEAERLNHINKMKGAN